MIVQLGRLLRPRDVAGAAFSTSGLTCQSAILSAFTWLTARDAPIARCADRPITTTPPSRDSMLDVPVRGTAELRVQGSSSLDLGTYLVPKMLGRRDSGAHGPRRQDPR